MKPELKEFAKLIVQHVRDRAIQSADVSIRTDSQSPVAKRWRAAGVARAEVVIPDVVDETIFYLLDAIDQELIRLSFVADDGSVVDLLAAGGGELGGWFVGSDEWRKAYSKERFADDFADLG